jgi:hypothetical protein
MTAYIALYKYVRGILNVEYVKSVFLDEDVDRGCENYESRRLLECK